MHRASLIVSALFLFIGLITICNGRSIKPISLDEMSLEKREHIYRNPTKEARHSSLKRKNDDKEDSDEGMAEIYADIAESIKNGVLTLDEVLKIAGPTHKEKVKAELAKLGIKRSIKSFKILNHLRKRHI
ncbi:hypothetical protein I4U23_021973 [Adineta vaga]|nr:hypothetical protein I4U23_021973 [Adineta vaga]